MLVMIKNTWACRYMKEYLSNNNSNTKIKEHVSKDEEHVSMDEGTWEYCEGTYEHWGGKETRNK